MFFPRDEYEARWARVNEEMARRGHAHLIVWQRSAGTFDRAGDLLWLTGFSAFGTGQDIPDEVFTGGYTFAAAVISRGGAPVLHTGQAADETDTSRIAYGEIVHHPTGLMKGLGEWLTRQGIEGPVAVAGSDILPAIYERVLERYAPAISWTIDDALMLECQAVKSPRELDAFRQAGEIATRSLTAGMEALIRGESTAEAAGRAASIVMSAGGGIHRVDMSHGPRSSRYLLCNDFYGYDTTRPEPGDLVRGWIMGPIYKGYWMDPGRTAVCGGRPSPAQRSLLEGAAAVVDGIVAATRAGVTPRELGRIGSDLARQAGYFDQPQLNVPLLGHRLGTFFEPYAIPLGDPGDDPENKGRYDDSIQPGMILAAEIFLNREGVGTAAFEQNFIVTETGAELLCRTPMMF